MFARTALTGLLATTVATSGLLLTAVAPAQAAYTADPADAAFSPVISSDVIGGGSDTSQHALKLLADAFNAANPGAGYKVATFAATGGGQITLPGGAVNRPN